MEILHAGAGLMLLTAGSALVYLAHPNQRWRTRPAGAPALAGGLVGVVAGSIGCAWAWGTGPGLLIAFCMVQTVLVLAPWLARMGAR